MGGGCVNACNPPESVRLEGAARALGLPFRPAESTGALGLCFFPEISVSEPLEPAYAFRPAESMGTLGLLCLAAVSATWPLEHSRLFLCVLCFLSLLRITSIIFLYVIHFSYFFIICVIF